MLVVCVFGLAWRWNDGGMTRDSDLFSIFTQIYIQSYVPCGVNAPIWTRRSMALDTDRSCGRSRALSKKERRETPVVRDVGG